MNITVIDSDNYAAQGIETMFFPGGEPHVKVPEFQDDVILYLKARTWWDTTFGALVANALEHQGKLAEVFMPYFPAARQDKTNGRAALTLEVVGQMFEWHPISVFDPHSIKIHSHVRVMDIFMPTDLDLDLPKNIAGVITPDKGAHERAKAFREHFCPTANEIICEKIRNQDTGRIERYEIVKPPTRVGHYIVVDDICDGGGTFNLLAETLNNDSFGKDSTLELVVSHGIFSQGLDAISPKYTHIITTDSWCQLPSSDRLSVYSLKLIVEKIVKENEENA